MRGFLSAATLAACTVVTGCSIPVAVDSTSAAYEVRPNVNKPPLAFYVLADDLTGLKKTISPTYVCGAWSYPIDMGATLGTSVRKTLEGAYREVRSASPGNAGDVGAPTFVFRLDEFAPRIRFDKGFAVGSAEASVEFSMVVSARDNTGTEKLSTVVRGSANASESGTCTAGGPALSQAAQKAVRVSLENFVSKVVNSDWQRP